MVLQFNRPLEMSGLYVIYANAGAYVEKTGTYGTSHLMEHMVHHLVDCMEDRMHRDGIYMNAFTWCDHVVFMIRGLSSRMEKVVPEYISRLTGINGYSGIDEVSTRQFDNEKNTVMNEYNDSFSSFKEGNSFNAMRKAYGLYGPIGRADDINAFTYEDFRDTYERIFRHPSMVVYVGPRNISIPEPECSPLPGNIERPLVFDDNRKCVLEPVSNNGRRPIDCIGKVPCPVKDSLALDIAIDMLTDGLRSPLYQELREKRGLTYYSCGYQDKFGTVAIPSFWSCTDEAGLNQVMGIYSDVFSHLDKYLSKARYDIVYGSYKARKEQDDILLYEDYSDIMRDTFGWCGSLRGLSDITYEGVLEVANNYISLDKMFFFAGK